MNLIYLSTGLLDPVLAEAVFSLSSWLGGADFNYFHNIIFYCKPIHIPHNCNSCHFFPALLKAYIPLIT